MAVAILIGANSVYARGMSWGGWFGPSATAEETASRHQTMFQEQANLLGVSVDDVKNAWAQGKNMRDLAKEKGITNEQLQQKMKDSRDAQMKTRIQTLVDKGVITQAQADQRLKFTQTMQNKFGKGMKKGLHRNFDF